MKLEHIALNILDNKEVKDFYQDVLGMEIVKTFSINNDLSKKFFNIDNNTPAYLMKKDNVVFELFINETFVNNSYSHICMKVENREKIVKKAKKQFYKCVIREREVFDQIFLSDKSSNIFELKNA